MIELYNHPLSPCGEKVRFALLEKGLPFREVVVDLAEKENLRAEFLALNPRGLVPALRDGATVVVESSVINEYLDDAYPAPPLRPSRPGDRARMRVWTKLVDERLHPAWPALAWPVLIRPRWLGKSAGEVEAMLAAMPDPRKRERQRAMLALGTETPEYRASRGVLKDVLDEMERTLAADPWLAGEALSLADLSLLPYVFAAELFGLGPWMLEDRPRCAAWYRRLCDRPAFGGDLRRLYPSPWLERVEAGLRSLSA